MRDKVVDKILFRIKANNKNLDDIKLEEIRYGLQAMYTLITKTTVIFILALLFNVFTELIIFFFFYTFLRSVGYGAHANSNIQCWIFSTLLLLGIPILFSYITLNMSIKIILWSIFFINFLIFAPAETRKKPMVNKKRKLKLKILILIISLVYLLLIINFSNISNMILGAMLLESFLVNPLGYIIMGDEVRFSLNELYIFKLN